MKKSSKKSAKSKKKPAKKKPAVRKKVAKKKSTPRKKEPAKGTSSNSPIIELLGSPKCKLRCPQCGGVIGKFNDSDECLQAARDHNAANPGHQAYCDCVEGA